MIYDTFLFYNELELLEIRLEELKDVVDRFVLIEASQTHSGKSKPLYFSENKGAFARFPIEHIVIDEHPSDCVSPWQRENYPRHRLSDHLRKMNLKPDDIVLLSDLDEIPRAELVAKCKESIMHEVRGTIYVFQQELSYYYVNFRGADQWGGTRLARWQDITDLQTFRFTRGVPIPDGGWHFSYLGGNERIREKITAFAHTELDRPEFLNPDHVDRCMADGTDLYGRGVTFEVVPLDYSFPRFLLDNRKRFAKLIKDYRDEALSQQLYEHKISTGSDIFEHLPYLYRLATIVDHITEFGTNLGKSTSAFIYAKPQRLITYDIGRTDQVSLLEKAAFDIGVEFTFHLQDVLQTEIEPTDLLFIDTWHVEHQLQRELALHADKARVYIVLHDTETFGQFGETNGVRGIWPAVSEFIRTHSDWDVLQHFPNNNGLTVLMRVPATQGLREV